MRKLLYKDENILNIPNLLSFYRLAISPLILFFALSGFVKLYAIFICISLFSDILDGNIARYFKLQTRFGAALDNLADMCTYVLAFLGIYLFKWNEIQPYAWAFYMFVITLLISYLVAFIRFKKIPGLHLYSAVSSGYAQGIFIFALFSFGFSLAFFYIVCFWGTLAYIEKILVLFRLDRIKPGVKGLYWLLQDQDKTGAK